jgi:decaprenyl-phosphate phosphoribosyltransferase
MARTHAAPRAHPAAHNVDVDVDVVKQSPGRPRPRVAVLRPRPRPVAVWVRAVRVRQWPKNMLVFAAPATVGVLSRPDVLERVSLMALAFCLLSSVAYLVNDLRDAPEDRGHPVKRHRPIAARLITPARALAAAAAMLAAGLGMATSLGHGGLAVAASYVVLNVAYTSWLRRIAIADIAAIAGAFVIRAAAGGVVAGVAPSWWFFVVVSSAAVLVAAGKRYADFIDPASRTSRAALADYNADFLRMVMTAALAVAVAGYCAWAFQTARLGTVGWREVTIIPFTFGLLRYLLLVSGGRGAAPEEVLFGDGFMQLISLAWLLSLTPGVV